MPTLVAWVLAAILLWCQALGWLRADGHDSRGRLTELSIVSYAIADAAESYPMPPPWDTPRARAALLVSIGRMESGWSIHAVGKLGEIGVWQLLPPPLGAPVPRSVTAQAREALRRWHTQGPSGYTSSRPHSDLVIARELPAAMLTALDAP